MNRDVVEGDIDAAKDFHNVFYGAGEAVTGVLGELKGEGFGNVEGNIRDHTVHIYTDPIKGAEPFFVNIDQLAGPGHLLAD